MSSPGIGVAPNVQHNRLDIGRHGTRPGSTPTICRSHETLVRVGVPITRNLSSDLISYRALYIACERTCGTSVCSPDRHVVSRDMDIRIILLNLLITRNISVATRRGTDLDPEAEQREARDENRARAISKLTFTASMKAGISGEPLHSRTAAQGITSRRSRPGTQASPFP